MGINFFRLETESASRKQTERVRLGNIQPVANNQKRLQLCFASNNICITIRRENTRTTHSGRDRSNSR